MFGRSTAFVVVLAVFGFSAVFASHAYGNAAAAADVVAPQILGEAQAAAISNAAGAKASAAKLSIAQSAALDRYGHEIGVPLLARRYGALSNLYAAALPPRSFVARIDPAFVKDGYGGVKHIGEGSIGVVAI